MMINIIDKFKITLTGGFIKNIRYSKCSVKTDNKNSSLLTKFIFSYILVLIIPTLLFGSILYKKSIESLKKEVKEGTLLTLSHTMNNIDNRLLQLKNICTLIPRNKILQGLFHPQVYANMDGYSSYNIFNEFSNYKANNLFIEDIFLYIPLYDEVIGSVGKQSLPSLYRSKFSGLDGHEEKLRQELKTDSDWNVKSLYYDSESTAKPITSYIYTYKIDSSFNPSIVIIMNDFTLTKVISSSLEHYYGAVYLFDDKNSPVVCTSKGSSYISQEDALRLIDTAPEASNVYEKKIEGRDYIVSFVKSPTTNWTCLVVLPSKQILNKVIAVKNLMLIVLALALLIGLILTYYFSYYNYSSITKIVELLKNLPGVNLGNECYKNEYEFINNILADKIAKDKALQKKLDDNMPMFKTEFLTELLQGSYSDMGSVEEISDFVGIKFRDKAYVVMIFNIDDYDELKECSSQTMQNLYKFSISNVVEELGRDIGHWYSIDTFGNKLISIVGLNKKEDYGSLIDLGNKTIEFFNEHFNFTITVGIGRVYSSLLDIPKTYNEAQEAVEYKMLRGGNTVIPFESINLSDNGRLIYSFQDQFMIKNYLKTGNFSGICEVLNGIMETINKNPVSIKEARCLYFEIVNTAMKSLGELSSEEYNLIIQNKELPNLMKCESLVELYKHTVSFYKIICNGVLIVKQNKARSYSSSILNYVQEHFDDSSLSLGLLCEKFSITQPSLSRLFKNETGKNFVEYLHALRIEKAKKLLVTEDKSIFDIASECGYIDNHSFIRNFKKLAGITPSSYRKVFNTGLKDKN